MYLVRELEKLRKKYKGVVGYSARLQDELVKGKPSGRKAIRIYVEKKKSRRSLKKAQLLPDEMFGIPVDVVAIGKPKLQALAPVVTPLSNPKRKFRPIIGGISTSGDDTGTMAYPCKDGNSRWYALSCCHVYGRTNGRSVLQQGAADGGTVATGQIGTLTRWQTDATVDAAIARIDTGALGAINGLPAPPAVGQAQIGMRVRKSGRTTGVTYGEVIDDDLNINVGGRMHTGQILIDGGIGGYWSAGGDSGSLVISDGNVAVGLHFAGSNPAPGVSPVRSRYGYANHIFNVLAALRVALVAPGESYP
jgi:hypothetical protein